MKKYGAGPIKWGMRAGAMTGGLLFLAFGILPGFSLGGYAAIMILKKLFGGPLEPTIFTRLVVASGMTAGILSSFAACVGAGAIFGASAGWCLDRTGSGVFAANEADEKKEIKEFA
ncbi:MAG: hypothetical protein EPN22_15850 [Nitrospirae bacterium]|nr:MAG: hypothetical protein EPN22_15850 [Nitrospirota bacterium]